MSNDIHEIYAVKYGRHSRKKAENYIGGDPHDTDEPIDYFVWAIVGPSGNVVVDTGFDHAMAQKRGRTIEKPIAGAVHQMWLMANSVNGPGSDFTEITKIIEKWAGVEVRARKK